jgi:hypothetical protein
VQWDDLRVFLAVAQAGSLRKAARHVMERIRGVFKASRAALRG